MLIIVHHWDIEFLDQSPLNLEALGGLDVLEVDAAKCWRYRLDRLDELVDVRPIDLNVENIDVGECLEQQALAFHHRLSCKRPDVAQSEHRSAVADHRHQIALGGVLVSVIRIVLDLLAGVGYSRRVSQRQLTLGSMWFGWNHCNLPSGLRRVVVQCILAQTVFVQYPTSGAFGHTPLL